MVEFIIAPKHVSSLPMRGGGYMYLRIFYESLAGHRYMSTYAFTSRDEMVTVYVANSSGQKSIGEESFDAKSMSKWQIAERDFGGDALQ